MLNFGLLILGIFLLTGDGRKWFIIILFMTGILKQKTLEYGWQFPLMACFICSDISWLGTAQCLNSIAVINCSASVQCLIFHLLCCELQLLFSCMYLGVFCSSWFITFSNLHKTLTRKHAVNNSFMICRVNMMNWRQNFLRREQHWKPNIKNCISLCTPRYHTIFSNEYVCICIERWIDFLGN